MQRHQMISEYRFVPILDSFVICVYKLESEASLWGHWTSMFYVFIVILCDSSYFLLILTISK